MLNLTQTASGATAPHFPNNVDRSSSSDQRRSKQAREPYFPNKWTTPTISIVHDDVDAETHYTFNDRKVELLEVDDEPRPDKACYRLYRHVTLKGCITADQSEAKLGGIKIDVSIFALTPARPPFQTVITNHKGEFVAHAVVIYAQANNHIGSQCTTGATIKFHDADRYGDNQCQIANFCRNSRDLRNTRAPALAVV